MALDAPTLIIALMVVCGVLSALLGTAWLSDRSVPGLGLWAIAFSLGTTALALFSGRGVVPDFASIDLANAMILLAFGLGWRGARVFAGRPGPWGIVVAGALLWLIACQIPVFQETFRLRVIVASLVMSGFAFAIASELWLVARPSRTTRLVAILLACHGAFQFTRFLSGFVAPSGFSTTNEFGEPFFRVIPLESMVFTISLAFLLLSANRERLTLLHRRAALVDPLTEVANRRGFLAEAERAIARALRNGAPTALLLLDLDHFKQVNDNFGHQAGDDVLVLAAAAVESELRAGDLIGRLGGEEFGVLLPDADAASARAIGERIRLAVARLRVPASKGTIAITTSIGVAAATPARSIGDLVAAADNALYRAKHAGRDRVECAAPGLHLATSPSSIARFTAAA
jgi:diguanylate cyclase (GGDEF)-like protein